MLQSDEPGCGYRYDPYSYGTHYTQSNEPALLCKVPNHSTVTSIEHETTLHEHSIVPTLLPQDVAFLSVRRLLDNSKYPTVC